MAATDKKRGTLHSKMGRPKSEVMSGFPARLKADIISMRTNHAGWGPSTILAELQQDEKWSTTQLPSRATIANLLKEQNLVKNYEKNVPLPVPACIKAESIHSHWQIDGQGNSQVKSVGPIAMLNIKDVYSSLYVSSFPARMKSMQAHPSTSDYQTAMRLGFLQHGLPQRLQSDHASVFYENKSKSPFPTRFCLWLIGLGIQPCFSRVNQPTDQGKVEKAHQTIFDQVLLGRNDYQSWEQLFENTQSRRQQLNQFIPSKATDGKAPLVKYPKARHSGRFYHLHQEAELLDMNRVFDFLAKGMWYRKVASNGTVCIGGQVYYISKSKLRQQLQISFCAKSQNLIFQNDKELVITKAPIKGINREILMGNLEQYAQFHSLQLEIPFNWEAQKLNTTFLDFN